ncbi:MAG TPA: hypothetical protein PLH57_00145 [Oligoflexia bacterium]|nr:hypothetical protein [Oligoflexia bacterium]
MGKIEFSSERGKCPACRTENVILKEVSGIHVCEKCASKRFSTSVRKRIEEAYNRQMDAKRREAWMQRMVVAKRGVKYYEEGKLLESLKCFRDYITILESRYRVPPGGLHPSLFDVKKDAGELLLIAGVYWDMVKAYDHIKGHTGEMRGALNKFLEFSIDRPHVILASETIRKYVASGSAVHVNDFKRAHEQLRSNLSKCFIATAVYGPKSDEVAALRAFRDHFLNKNLIGRSVVGFYYAISPPLARLAVRQPRIADAIRPFLNLIVRSTKRASRLSTDR